MSPAAAVSIEPFFLDGPKGRLCAVEVAPARRADVELAILCCAPFAEELNRTRRAVQLAAQRLARRGCSVLLLDLYGTGDSEGELVDARWEGWLADLRAAQAWLRAQRCERVGLWGVRLGAALALDVAAGGACEQLLLWQPVAQGSVFLSQFLRLRVAADMLATEAASSVGALRAELTAGATVEIAGYEITPALAQAIDAVDLARYADSHLPAIDWVEAVAAPERPLSVASRALVERWQRESITVRAYPVVAQPFWATAEIVVPESFLDVTDRIAATWTSVATSA